MDRTIIKLFISHGCCWLTLRLDTLNVKQAGALSSLHWQLQAVSHSHSSLTLCLLFFPLEICPFDLLHTIHKDRHDVEKVGNSASFNPSVEKQYHVMTSGTASFIRTVFN